MKKNRWKKLVAAAVLGMGLAVTQPSQAQSNLETLTLSGNSTVNVSSRTRGSTVNIGTVDEGEFFSINATGSSFPSSFSFYDHVLRVDVDPRINLENGTGGTTTRNDVVGYIELSATRSNIRAVDEGTYTFPISMTNTSSAADDDLIARVTVRNVAPTITVAGFKPSSDGVITNGNISIPEGSFHYAEMMATDPGADEVNYFIDGSYAGFRGFGGNQAPFAQDYRYPNDGIFSVTFTAIDQDEADTSLTRTVTVTNVAPTITARELRNGSAGNFTNFNITINEGSVLEARMSSTDPGADAQTFTIGGLSAGAGGTSGTRTSNTVDLSSSVANDGTFTVNYRVADDDTSTNGTRSVTILNVAPTITASELRNGSTGNFTNGNITINEGSVLQARMSSTDPGADAQTFTIGGLSAGVGGTSGTRSSNTVDLSSSVANDGSFSVNYRVADDDTSTNGTRSVTILNVAPTITAAELRNGSTGSFTNGNITIDEGSPLFARMSSTDPGADAQTFTIGGLSAGVGGTSGTRSSNTVDLSSSVLNDGLFTMNYRVADDDTFTTMNRAVTVRNVAPTVSSFLVDGFNGPIVLLEGQTYTAQMSATDPGADPLAFQINGLSAEAQRGLDRRPGSSNYPRARLRKKGPGDFRPKNEPIARFLMKRQRKDPRG
jgi:hypothetical protein